MSKKYNIQGSDLDELKRVAKNFNSKISYHKKKDPTATHLPEKIKVSEAIENIQSKRDYNRLLKSMQSFNKRGAEKPVEIKDGITTSKWFMDEAKKTTKNFNAKVKRFKAKNPDYETFYIKEVKPDEIIQKAKTTADFQEEIESMKKFLNPKASEIVKTSKSGYVTPWESEKYKRLEEKENEEKRKLRENLESKEVKVGGKGTGQTRAQMGSLRENEHKESHKDPFKMSQKELQKAFTAIDRRLDEAYKLEKQELMRNNYLQGLLDNGFLEANPDIEKWVRGVSFEDFYANVETDDTATFTFYKDPLGFQVRLEKISDTWRTLYESSVK